MPDRAARPVRADAGKAATCVAALPLSLPLNLCVP